MFVGKKKKNMSHELVTGVLFYQFCSRTGCHLVPSMATVCSATKKHPFTYIRLACLAELCIVTFKVHEQHVDFLKWPGAHWSCRPAELGDTELQWRPNISWHRHCIHMGFSVVLHHPAAVFDFCLYVRARITTAIGSHRAWYSEGSPLWRQGQAGPGRCPGMVPGFLNPWITWLVYHSFS